MKKSIIIILLCQIILALAGCKEKDAIPADVYEYGVFLNYEGDLFELDNYKIIVIDAQYADAEDIRKFREKGHTVYSYINVGSLENFRDYYEKFSDITLDEYEHWEEEMWVDVSQKKWQEFILQTLAQELIEKGIDGFFVDNCDVYYNYKTSEVFESLVTILKGLMETGKKVIINGGDYFLDAYCDSCEKCSDIITGINQEFVFTAIDWEDNSLDVANSKDNEYYTSYLEQYKDEGIEIFLLEYGADEYTKKKIEEYCNNNNFMFYISDSLELN